MKTLAILLACVCAQAVCAQAFSSPPMAPPIDHQGKSPNVSGFAKMQARSQLNLLASNNPKDAETPSSGNIEINAPVHGNVVLVYESAKRGKR